MFRKFMVFYMRYRIHLMIPSCDEFRSRCLEIIRYSLNAIGVLSKAMACHERHQTDTDRRPLIVGPNVRQFIANRSHIFVVLLRTPN